MVVLRHAFPAIAFLGISLTCLAQDARPAGGPKTSGAGLQPPRKVGFRSESQRMEDYADEMLFYLRQGSFDYLDQEAGRLRRDKQRFPNGDWKLFAFYEGGRERA